MPLIDAVPRAWRIGEYLDCSRADIEWALSVQATESAAGNTKRLGEILLAREEITEEDLKQALKKQRVDRLRRCSLLEDLSQDDLTSISERIEEVKLPAGEDLFREDQRGDSMYVVARGHIGIYRQQDGLKPAHIRDVGPGTVLGELGYFTEGTRSCSATTLDPTVVLKIRYELLSDFII